MSACSSCAMWLPDGYGALCPHCADVRQRVVEEFHEEVRRGHRRARDNDLRISRNGLFNLVERHGLEAVSDCLGLPTRVIWDTVVGVEGALLPPYLHHLTPLLLKESS